MIRARPVLEILMYFNVHFGSYAPGARLMPARYDF